MLINMGWKYFQFRISYEFRRKTGLLKKKFPINPPFERTISLSDWRSSKIIFLYNTITDINAPKVKDTELLNNFNRILNGEIFFFNAVWYNLGLSYDWVTNPETNYQYSKTIHWTEIEDLNEIAGDIKNVWEKSRFSYLLTVMRYDYHYEEDHSEFVFDEIVSFIDHNPLNQGPNYKCSQEISIRVLNWLLLLYFYKESSFLKDNLFDKIIYYIHWQMQHVYDNIDFSRISVRNNHAITETSALFIVGTLFPELPNARKWQLNGKKWLEEEVDYQIYDDGTYLQFSHNYHRVVIQDLTYVIAIAKLNDIVLSEKLIDKSYKSINFLFQSQDLTSGELSNYGSNDGALFFNFGSLNYRDYRPQLDALYYLITGNNLYEKVFEDRYWFASLVKVKSQFPNIELIYGISRFDKGGIYLYRDRESLTMLVCTQYKDRPAHADGLHLDVWYKGSNILFDAGSYKYNTTDELKRYFNGSESHNTVMLDKYDHMLKGPRFIWLNWIKKSEIEIYETPKFISFIGKIDAYNYLNKRIRITRKVVKFKDTPVWEVEDRIIAKPENLKFIQLWHTNYSNVNLVSSGDMNEQKGFVSNLYAVKEISRQLSFSSTTSYIKTTISIKK